MWNYAELAMQLQYAVEEFATTREKFKTLCLFLQHHAKILTNPSLFFFCTLNSNPIENNTTVLKMAMATKTRAMRVMMMTSSKTTRKKSPNPRPRPLPFAPCPVPVASRSHVSLRNRTVTMMTTTMMMTTRVKKSPNLLPLPFAPCLVLVERCSRD
jgi:hypothetical protein